MDGLALLGAQPIEEYLGEVAAAPVVTKLQAAGQRAAAAADKLKKSAPKAAAKLKALAGHAHKAAKQIVKPPAAKPVAKPAAPSPPAKPPHPPARPGHVHLGGSPSLYVDPGLKGILQHLDIDLTAYNFFGDQTNDAAVAGEAIDAVNHYLDKLQAGGKTDLVAAGNALIDRANAIIDAAKPPDSSADGGS